MNTNQELVTRSKKGNAITNTLLVAKKFGKQHKSVLRAFRNLEISEDFNAHNFAPVNFLDAKGEKREMIVMTKAGFTMLAFSFTGKLATTFREEYIKEFERKEAEIAVLHQELQRQQQPAPQRALPEFNQRDIQLESSKNIARKLVQRNRFPAELLAHHRSVSLLLTGQNPSEYRQDLVNAGLKMRHKSAREIMRRVDPPKAAAAAFIDDCVFRGNKTIDEIKQAGIHTALPAAFAAMQRLGIEINASAY